MASSRRRPPADALTQDDLTALQAALDDYQGGVTRQLAEVLRHGLKE